MLSQVDIFVCSVLLMLSAFAPIFDSFIEAKREEFATLDMVSETKNGTTGLSISPQNNLSPIEKTVN